MDYLITARVNGRASRLPALSFGDETGTYGQFRRDTEVIGIAVGVELVKDLSGVYSYEFTEESPATSYQYSLAINGGDTTYYYVGRHSYSNVKKTIIMPSTQHYTSEAEVRRVLGKYAVDLMLDDDDTTDTRDLWVAVFGDVDDTIDMYLGQMYDLPTLLSNNWVRRRATVLAVNLLSMRRGNNPIYIQKVERTYEELEAIRDGRFHVPGGTILGFQGPAVRNYLLQNRFKRHPLRVEKSKSTGDAYSGEDIALEPYVY